MTIATIKTIEDLMDARIGYARAALEYSKAERNLKLQRVKSELTIIDAAGGEKELGPNADARKRALAIALEDDPDYRQAQAASDNAYMRRATAEAHLKSLEEMFLMLVMGCNSEPV